MLTIKNIIEETFQYETTNVWTRELYITDELTGEMLKVGYVIYNMPMDTITIKINHVKDDFIRLIFGLILETFVDDFNENWVSFAKDHNILTDMLWLIAVIGGTDNEDMGTFTKPASNFEMKIQLPLTDWEEIVWSQMLPTYAIISKENELIAAYKFSEKLGYYRKISKVENDKYDLTALAELPAINCDGFLKLV